MIWREKWASQPLMAANRSDMNNATHRTYPRSRRSRTMKLLPPAYISPPSPQAHKLRCLHARSQGIYRLNRVDRASTGAIPTRMKRNERAFVTSRKYTRETAAVPYLSRPFSFSAPTCASLIVHAPNSWSDVQSSPDIRTAVKQATRFFQAQSVAEPEASAEYLAIRAFTSVESRPSARQSAASPSKDEMAEYVRLCKDREERRVPVQYLVGEWDFHHINVLVRPPVLIPRPETEDLVELVLNNHDDETRGILDVGCGSGAILCALLARRRDWRGLGIDIAHEAIQLSRDNLDRVGVQDRGSVLLGDISKIVESGRKFDVIVSNPPYINDGDTLDREVMEHEDHRALFAGKDGLSVIREILASAPKVLKTGGKLWMEVGLGQVSELGLLQFKGMRMVRGHCDFSGRERFCEYSKEQ